MRGKRAVFLAQFTKRELFQQRLRFLNQFQNIRVCVKAVYQSVGNAVIPMNGDGNKPRMDILPAFDGKQHMLRLRTAVKDRHIVKLRSVLNIDLGVVCLQVVPDEIVHAGIPFFYHHQGFAVQVAQFNDLFICQPVLIGNGDHLFIPAQGLTDSSFAHHLKTAKANGITKTEIAEILTHAAFYAGWPKAWAAFRLAKEIWTESDGASEKQTHANAMIFPIGEPNTAFAKYFIGQSYLAPLSKEQVGIFNVTFEPACRNNWHIHKADKGGGQILICVAGKGYYQEWGKEAQLLLPGDVVNIPAGVKHWHGAAKDSWFSHLAVEVPGENTGNEWCEEVSDEAYAKL